MNACCSTEQLLTELAQTKGASDLLLTVGKEPQLRIHNEVVSLGYNALTPENAEQMCVSILNEEQLKRFKSEKEIDLSLQLNGAGRFRINIYQQRGCLALVARSVLDRVATFTELGLPRIVGELASLRRGLVLFTGPVGTGKSTSVASIIDHINKTRPCHIISVEDPIEYVHTHALSTIDQREVGQDTHSFHEALRRILRQSPDVIVIGEIRDRESAQAAITLAETGHLILATLHTRGAIASVNRLIDMFPPEQNFQIRSQLAASLAAVIWQQLLPAKKGKALVLACEVMIAIPAIRALIRQGRTHEIYSLIQTGRKYGMFTMEQAFEDLINRELVDSEWFKTNYFDLNNIKD